MRRPSTLVCVRASVLALPVFLACASNSSNVGNNNGNGTDINNGTGTDDSTSTGSGGNNGTGTNTTTGSNVSGSNGSSGSSNVVEVLPDGGSVIELSDGAVVSVPPDAGSKRVCAVANADVIADFEDDKAEMVASNGFTGIWYDFSDTANGAATPTLVIGTSTDPNPSCNKYAMHTTGGLKTTAATFAGTRGDFLAHLTPAGSTTANTFPPADAIPTNATGISFDIETGSATPSLTFEVVTQDTQPQFAGGSVPDSGAGSAQYNNRGWMLTTSATQTNAALISSSWQTVHIPFATLIPIFLVSGCPDGVLCQAPAFDPSQALGIQFVQNTKESPSGTYDIWVDNITFDTTATNPGLTPPNLPNSVSPAFADGAMGSCTKPTIPALGAAGAASGNDVLWAYRNWYSRFVTSAGNGQLKVIRPENNNDTVSEGIGYGMLIAVAMNDSTLFAGLYAYWQANLAVSGTAGLMTWNNTGGAGSATDADQDAAFALLQAGKKFNNAGYTSAGTAMVGLIWNDEVDKTSMLPTGGSNYGNSTSSHVTDPSYFAPEYYTAFGKVDTAHNWAGVASAVYTALNAVANSTTGLAPAWCANNCTTPGMNTGGASDETYQYDSHRIPWRVGLDYCWHGTAAAKSFLTKSIAFFDGIGGTAGANGGGLGRLGDQYNLSGSPSSTAPNSMSLIGCAGVGAMATGTTDFVNSAWQFLLDGSNRATLDVAATGSMSGYSYFNATVGLLTLLSMSGNLPNLI